MQQQRHVEARARIACGRRKEVGPTDELAADTRWWGFGRVVGMVGLLWKKRHDVREVLFDSTSIIMMWANYGLMPIYALVNCVIWPVNLEEIIIPHCFKGLGLFQNDNEAYVFYISQDTVYPSMKVGHQNPPSSVPAPAPSDKV